MDESIRHPRGSQWRKWDLQVHTPFSELNNGFGSDFLAYAKELLSRAVQKKIAAVGITDYFTIEGYSRLKSLLADRTELERLVGKDLAEESVKILFIPNVELRSSIIIRSKNGEDNRVNFHILFSDSVSPSDIQENFLREIKFTVEGNLSAPDEEWSLTSENLSTLGKRLKSQHSRFHNKSDLFVGLMNAVVDHGKVTTILEGKPSLFKDKYLFCLPCDEDLSKCSWDGQGHLTRKVFVQKSHFLFSSNQGTRDFGLGKKHATHDDFVHEFKGLKPCLHSSDAHDFNALFEPKESRYTWIKGDPTFQGLRQLLNEPEDRVFIGQEPETLKKAAGRSTKIVDKIRVTKKNPSSLPERWFDVSLPLNAELVAIIGNKGSGKSALADILGLVGNTPRFGSFSFLRADRFRDSKNNKSKHFEATLTWADGSSEPTTSLDAEPEEGSVEKVKYIPQNYLEEICNEVGLGKGSRFYSELQDVIAWRARQSSANILSPGGSK